LRKLLEYDPVTGNFTWLRAHQKIRIGDVAGTLDNKGYVRIRLDGRKYRAHRLAWFYMTGNWPVDQLDHRDKNKANNAFGNLREADNTQNNGNRVRQPNNTSGYRGVSWFKPRKRWRAQIAKQHLGYFVTREEAAAAYEQAAIIYFGPFVSDYPRVFPRRVG
jgi:hypothetical protein